MKSQQNRIELVTRPGGGSSGLADLAGLDESDPRVDRTAEVQLQQLNLRLSYHDWIMFQTILESFPRQANRAMANSSGGQQQNNKAAGSDSGPPANIRGQVGQLMALGFTKDDCQLALQVCQGRLDEAALWLTHNADPGLLITKFFF